MWGSMASIVEDSTGEGGWTLRTLSLLPRSLWEVGRPIVGKKFARCIHGVTVFPGSLIAETQLVITSNKAVPTYSTKSRNTWQPLQGHLIGLQIFLYKF